MSGNDVFIIDCIVTGVVILGIYLYNKNTTTDKSQQPVACGF